jgi:hypothetical protein
MPISCYFRPRAPLAGRMIRIAIPPNPSRGRRHIARQCRLRAGSQRRPTASVISQPVALDFVVTRTAPRR